MTSHTDYQIPPKPATSDYGYKRGWKLVGCSREELIARCASTDLMGVKRVWTPETPGLVLPESVDFLRPALHQAKLQQNREFGYVSTVGLIAGAFLLLMGILFKDRRMIIGYLSLWLGIVFQFFSNRRERRCLKNSVSDQTNQILNSEHRTTDN